MTKAPTSTSTSTFDSATQLAAVTRSVRMQELDGHDGFVTTLTQTFAAKRSSLWSAATEIARLAQWFAPVDGSLRQGGTYQIQDNAHGHITGCHAPDSFTLTWEYDGEHTHIEAHFTKVDETHATLTLEHHSPTDEETWPKFGVGATGVGWDLSFASLAHHLEAGATVPLETTSWVRGDDARSFLMLSAESWADASIAAGSDEADARAAQKRTTDAYLDGLDAADA